MQTAWAETDDEIVPISARDRPDRVRVGRRFWDCLSQPIPRDMVDGREVAPLSPAETPRVVTQHEGTDPARDPGRVTPSIDGFPRFFVTVQPNPAATDSNRLTLSVAPSSRLRRSSSIALYSCSHSPRFPLVREDAWIVQPSRDDASLQGTAG